MSYLCPHCHTPLTRDGNSCFCVNRHCFDYAKQGYLNLLCSNSSSNHGDDKMMVEARSRFLDAGHYAPLRDALQEEILRVLPRNVSLLDAGCGEGYYTHTIYETTKENGVSVFGVDVSKQAILHCCRRTKDVSWSVASVYDLPFPDRFFGGIVSVFSPFAKEEFERVLTTGGFLFMVIPLEDHLWELKRAVYNTPYKNAPSKKELSGFLLKDEKKIRYTFTLHHNDEVKSLFSMTPYAHNTSPRDMERLNVLTSLSVTADFSLLIYQKTP